MGFPLCDRLRRRKNGSNKSLYSLLYAIKRVLKHPVALFKSSTIGIFYGALPPCCGTIVATVVSCKENVAQRNRKGAEEGLISAESENNAFEGGVLATILSLGIPGGLATVVMMGVFMLQGFTPEPRLFFNLQGLVYGAMFAQVVASFFLLIAGLLVSLYAAKVVSTIVLILLMAVILGITLGPILDRQLMSAFQGVGELSFEIFLNRLGSLTLMFMILFYSAWHLLLGKYIGMQKGA
ncbi:tripartite tricarboxylate transporter permease [Billgrantia endophytica]|uniref:DUF112 domain-containing protein n=1 Tax=Billgrantia endophytica TaxID=2033802 RepID=A0A2N7TZH0_9GAMM|nr:tripartite tricarboxylate transporter permease [Halomonas endophytica]PMR73586.1 hypothetical protein C1H69_16835 [Halomonas endophytica]